MDRRRLLKVSLVVLGVLLAPGFGLTGADGGTVASDGFKGGFTLYTFDYADCAAECAPTRELFRALQDGLEVGADGVARVGEIPAGDSVTLRPGGIHLMLMGVRESGAVEVRAPVQHLPPGG